MRTPVSIDEGRSAPPGPLPADPTADKAASGHHELARDPLPETVDHGPGD
jgi:hypothetical protein